MSCSLKQVVLSVFLLWAGLVCLHSLRAQQFINSDLNGASNFSSQLPNGWQAVEESDPISFATNANIGDTPDVTGLSTPDLELGVSGQAFSGSKFVSGLVQASFGIVYQEGIKQSVLGFTPGSSYSLTFYQAVVKQIAALDPSGSWAVYLDDQLLGTTDPSQSDLAFDDVNLIWDDRSFNFTATATEHTFKFLPVDDDSNIGTSFTNTNGALRMGIDLITINANCDFDLGPDVTACVGEAISISTDLAGTYFWSTGETGSMIEVLESGTYSLTVVADCGTLTDEIEVTIQSPLMEIELGENIEACDQDYPIVLEAQAADGVYSWNTGSNNESISVVEPGTYGVTVSNSCGSVSDAIVISESPDQIVLDLGSDLTLCSEEFPVVLNAGLADSYVWNSGETEQQLTVESPGDYSVVATTSCGTFTDDIFVELVQAPAAFSLGEDLSICENHFPVTLEVPHLGNEILWSDGSESQQLLAEGGGIYSVDVFNQCGVSSAEISITSIPNQSGEQNIVLCEGESTSFLGTNYSSSGQYNVIEDAEASDLCDFYWTVNVHVIPTDTVYQFLVLAAGETLQFLGESFQTAGVFYVLQEAEETCDRLVELTIVEQAEVLIYVPSAFTPSGDGLNETFKPVVTLVGNIELTTFEFEVYNRWGQQIFKTNDNTTLGWDGRSGNDSKHYAQDEVYSWLIRYRTSQGNQAEELKGSVLLVR